MNQEFRDAKTVIRVAVAAAPRATVEKTLADARAGRVPFDDYSKCLAGHLLGYRSDGKHWEYWDDLSNAYANLFCAHISITKHHAVGVWLGDAESDWLIQRILVAILRADLRRRDREMVKALVESAGPALVEAGL